MVYNSIIHECERRDDSVTYQPNVIALWGTIMSCKFGGHRHLSGLSEVSDLGSGQAIFNHIEVQ